MSKGSFNYRNAYRQLSNELKDALSQREFWENKVTTLRQALAGVANLADKQEIEIQPSPEAKFLLETTGLTEDIVNVLKAKMGIPLSPQEIRRELEELGYEMRKYTNPLATIHMVLKRLEEQEPPRIQRSNYHEKPKRYLVPFEWESKVYQVTEETSGRLKRK